MELEQRIRKALRRTGGEFCRALCNFNPAPDRNNSYPERMVSYYYVWALARALMPRANVLLEIPITGKSKRGRDNHIDALISNDYEAVVAEFKVAWAPKHWKALAGDLKRPKTASVAKEIRTGFEKAERVFSHRRRSFVFLGADVWYPERTEAWKSGKKAGTGSCPRQCLLLNGITFGFIQTKEGVSMDIILRGR